MRSNLDVKRALTRAAKLLTSLFASAGMGMHSFTCSTRFVMAAGLAGCASILSALPASADVLPWSLNTSNVQYGTTSSQTVTNITGEGAVSGSGPGGSNVSATFSLDGPLVTLSGTANGQSSQVGGNVNLFYYFNVNGPSGSFVPIHVNAAGSWSLNLPNPNEGAFVQSFFSIINISNNSTPFSLSEDHQNNFTSSGSWSLDNTYSFLADTTYRVAMTVQGSAGINTAGGSASFSATVDPLFTIDPAYAGSYSLDFSRGVTNSVASVPGPVVGAGFPGMILAAGGFFMWVQRRRQAAA